MQAQYNMCGVPFYDNCGCARDETHHPPLLTRLGSTGLVKKANVVGENELVNEYLLCKLCREYIIFHDKTQWIFDRSTCPRQCISALKITIKLDSDLGTKGLYEWHMTKPIIVYYSRGYGPQVWSRVQIYLRSIYHRGSWRWCNSNNSTTNNNH